MKAEISDEKMRVYLRFGGLFAAIFLTIFVPSKTYIMMNQQLQRQERLHASYVAQTDEIINSLSSQVNTMGNRLKGTDAFRKEATCLAKNMYYEIGTESKEGMLAVAQVTLNRKREGFANSICGVVYQRTDTTCQFSWVCKDRAAPQPVRFKRAYDTAQKVLINGFANVKLRNALYFHADYSSPKWQDEKIFITQIGPHKFYSEKWDNK